jgi:hypothetical protein
VSGTRTTSVSPPPGPQFNHHKRQVLGEGVQCCPVPARGAFNYQDRDVSLAFETNPVTGPVLKDPKAVGGVNFPELHFDAVVRVTVRGEDVKGATPRCGELLGDDSDLA